MAQYFGTKSAVFFEKSKKSGVHEMIALDMSQQSKGEVSPLNISAKPEKPLLSFALLLNSVKDTQPELQEQKEEATPQMVRIISLLDKEIKSSDVKDTVDIQSSDENTLLTLNPKITDRISTKELKVILKQAKEYLKSKIMQSETFQRQEIKDLPKTLKGLVQLAQKVGVDVSKITLEDVRDIPLVSKKVAAFSKVKPLTKAKKQTLTVTTERPSASVHQVQIKKLPPKTPLFQTHKTVMSKMTTEEIVTAKLSNTATPKKALKKEKPLETLELLLRGKKVSKQHKAVTSLTADFSVETAKVIAPSITPKTAMDATTHKSESLVTLLHPKSVKEEEHHEKIQMQHTPKADAFEVKIHEAKQMVKYISQDIKTAIEDYKSPFTRVKVQLNPQRLGEVDVTIVQRGKNLHINLSSNNAAINTLSLNSQDLKVQLQHNGIQNASLNFSNNSQSGENASGQAQQQQQNRQEAHNEYNYFENEETNEEIVNSLEIIVPHYA